MQADMQADMQAHDVERLQKMVINGTFVLERDASGHTLFDKMGSVNKASVQFLVWLMDYTDSADPVGDIGKRSEGSKGTACACACPFSASELYEAIGLRRLASHPDTLEKTISFVKRTGYLFRDPFAFLEQPWLASTIELMRALLDAGADPNFPGPMSATPLHRCLHPKCVQLLLDRGADPNAVSSWNYTPLRHHFLSPLVHDPEIPQHPALLPSLQGTTHGLLLVASTVSDCVNIPLTLAERKEQIDRVRAWQQQQHQPSLDTTLNMIMPFCPPELSNLILEFTVGKREYAHL
jgi:hypothetical protein